MENKIRMKINECDVKAIRKAMGWNNNIEMYLLRAFWIKTKATKYARKTIGFNFPITHMRRIWFVDSQPMACGVDTQTHTPSVEWWYESSCSSNAKPIHHSKQFPIYVFLRFWVVARAAPLYRNGVKWERVAILPITFGFLHHRQKEDVLIESRAGWTWRHRHQNTNPKYFSIVHGFTHQQNVDFRCWLLLSLGMWLGRDSNHKCNFNYTQYRYVWGVRSCMFHVSGKWARNARPAFVCCLARQHHRPRHFLHLLWSDKLNKCLGSACTIRVVDWSDCCNVCAARQVAVDREFESRPNVA